MARFNLLHLKFRNSVSDHDRPSNGQDDGLEMPAEYVSDAGGIVGDMLIGTSRGWLRAREIRAGDKVLMVDMVWQRAISVANSLLWAGARECPAPVRPLYVPSWVLDNSKPLILLPEQYVLFDDYEVQDILGIEAVYVKAADLAGIFGIYRFAPSDPLPVVHLEFDDPEVVVIQGGTKVLCPHGIVSNGKAVSIWDDDPEADPLAPAVSIPALDAEQARYFLASLYNLTNPDGIYPQLGSG